MLPEFITSYRDPIIARTREKLTDRPWPLASTSELDHGVPLFLTQLSETLRLETPTPFSQKMSLRDLVDNALSDIRMAANIERRKRLSFADFLYELAIAANLHAESRAVQFAIDQVDPRLAVDADPQLLASAVMNLLTNAFKYTHAGGHVALRTVHENGRVRFEVEDECGGIPDGSDDPFKAFTARRQTDRTGLGLGLSIARKAVRKHGGTSTSATCQARAACW
jgi:signal transduction histidine kinase